MTRPFRLSIAFIALALFIGTTLWMPGMTGMDHGGMPMTDCPFMFGEEALCAMSALEHISSWKAMMTVIPPEIVVVVLLAFAAAYWFLRLLYDPPDPFFSRVYASLRLSSASPFSTILLGSAISPRAP